MSSIFQASLGYCCISLFILFAFVKIGTQIMEHYHFFFKCHIQVDVHHRSSNLTHTQNSFFLSPSAHTLTCTISIPHTYMHPSTKETIHINTTNGTLFSSMVRPTWEKIDGCNVISKVDDWKINTSDLVVRMGLFPK